MTFIANKSKILYVSEVASLSNGAEIDSAFIDGQDYVGFQVSVFGDSTGLTYRQSIKMSDSGVEDVLTFPLPSSVEASQDTTFSVPFRQRYLRIQIQNNSGVAITNVRLEVKGLRTISQPTVTTLSSEPVAQSQALLVQSVGIGRNSNGTYANQRVTALGASVSASIQWETVLGNVSGSTTWNKFGYNNDIDTGTSPEIVASFGGSFTPPTTADTLNFVSTNVNDTSGGTGINSIVITGVDENRVSQVEVLTLNGTTPVTTTNQWLGVNRVSPFLCGTSQVNQGTITGTHTTSGQVLAEMPVGENSTQQALLFIQAGHTFVATWLWINTLKLTGGGGSPKVTIKGWVYSPVANAKILIFEGKLDTDVENTIQMTPTEPFPITEQSVLWFEASTDTNNTAVDLRFSGIEVPNE